MRGRRPNFLVGIFLLVLLAMFAGPNLLPRFASNIIPGFDQGVPCEWLRRADNRANHQSLLGRSAENPFILSVRPGPITNDPAGVFTITVIVTNNSLGTVPLLYDPNQIIVGDNNTSGLGLIFEPPTQTVVIGQRGGDPVSYPENAIRLLGPRQSCIVRVEIPNGNVLTDPALTNGSTRVRAYYRVNSPGQVVQAANTLATPIYPDQGLWTGYVESEPVLITASGL